MIKMKLLLFWLIFILSCTAANDENKVNNRSNNELNRRIILAMIESKHDTIKNGSFYEAKVYLSSDSLYKVAKHNGIKDYLFIKYEDQMDSADYIKATKIPEIKGDTGIIKFRAYSPGLKKGEIIKLYWQAALEIDFLKEAKQNVKKIDTTIAIIDFFYLKN